MHEISVADSVVFRKRRQRVGRGIGSGSGKTCGRGHKGDGSRSGSKSRRGHEGGQKPIFRKVAKRGFRQGAFAAEVHILSTDDFERLPSDTVDVWDLLSLASHSCCEIRVLMGRDPVKKMTVRASYFTRAAEAAIIAAGGSCVRCNNGRS